MTPVDGSHTLGCAAPAAVVVLAGGRSTRMGTAKAALEWHGSTLLRHVTGIVGRAVDGPVIVVTWLIVGIPLAYGVFDAVTAALQLFG